MDIKTISVALVAVMVGTVMFGALIPIFDDVTATTDSFSNVDGSYGYMAELKGDGDDFTFIWDPINAPTKATVNGESVDMFSGTVVCSVGDMVARWGTSSTSGYYLQSVPNTFLPSIGANTATGNVTITAIDGVLTMTYGETTNTMDYTHGFMVAPSGEYVMKKSAQSVYLNGDSAVYATGLTSMGGVWNNALYFTGTIDDGYTVTQFYPSPATYTFSTPADDSTAVSGYTGLYTLTKITTVATLISDTSVTHDVTYSYFIVPAEVDGERTVHVTESEGAIIDLIPLIIGLGLVLMTVAFFLRKKL